MNWGRNVLVALDQLGNVLLKPLGIGGGDPDETLSSYWARVRFEKTIAKLASKILDKLDKDHAWDAIEFNPKTGQSEPHHMADYDKRRRQEEEAMIAAMVYDYLDTETASKAEMGFMRQRLREAMRDKARGRIE